MARRVSPPSREELVAIARAAVAAVDGEALVRAAVVARAPARRRTRVWAIGKASVAMARGAVAALGAAVDGGIVVGRAPLPPREALGLPPSVRVLAGAHPIPDERSAAAARALLDEARAARDGDEALVLLSGGASAIVGAPVAAPAGGLGDDALARATRTLLRAGLPIDDINAVRRHLALVGGGRLAQATRARLTVLALSDVVAPDDDEAGGGEQLWSVIGSGPTSADPTTRAEAAAIAARAGVDEAIVRAIADGPETAKPGDPALVRVVERALLATPSTLREAAVAAIAARDLVPCPRAALVTGDAVALAEELARAAAAMSPGEVLVAVGEPTVRVPPSAPPGGRAQHVALAAALALARAGTDAVVVALASDGSDGESPAAGACTDGAMIAEARARGLDPDGALAACAAHPLLHALGRTLVTDGREPPRTNLTDLFLIARRA
jgi:hydroxypyruvate reductase